MMEIKINPFIKFTLLIFQVVLLLVVDDIFKLFLLLCIGLFLGIVYKIKFKQLLFALKYGLFLAMFIFIFNFIIYKDVYNAFFSFVELLLRYFIIIIYSIIYKENTSNKEISYVISYIFLPLKYFGYNQNKVYTIILVTLNQIHNLRDAIYRIFTFNKLNHNGKMTFKTKIKKMILLIPVFLNTTLKQNENLAVGLINKGYNKEKKVIKPYLIYNYSVKNHILLGLLIIIEITICKGI